MTVCVVGVYAQNTVDDGTIQYRNMPVYKVYEHADAYIVMYYTTGVNLGQVTIPTEWFRQGSKKAVLRTLSGDFTPYMLLQYVDGVFSKVVLTMPANKTDSAWGVMDRGTDVVAGSQRDTLVLE